MTSPSRNGHAHAEAVVARQRQAELRRHLEELQRLLGEALAGLDGERCGQRLAAMALDDIDLLIALILESRDDLRELAEWGGALVEELPRIVRRTITTARDPEQWGRQ
jgi:hypothetical protein